MPSVRDQDISFFTQNMLTALTSDPVLAPLLRNALLYKAPSGAYSHGSIINVTVADDMDDTIIHTNFATNPDLSLVKGTLTNFPVELTALAVSNLYYDKLDNALSSTNEEAYNALTRQKTATHIRKVESDMFTRTFDLASLDANKLGTIGDPLTIDDLITLESIYADAQWEGDINLIIPPTMMAQIKKDFKNAYTGLTPEATRNDAREGIVINAVPRIKIYRSTNLPTITDMSNITGTSTNKIAFSYADESIALYNPALETVRNSANANVQNLTQAGLNMQVTSDVITTKYINEEFTKMVSLYGTGIFRPTVVKPILGGTIS